MTLQKRYKTYIRDIVVARALNDYEFANCSIRRLYAFFKRALSSYVKLRLLLMTKPHVIQAERYVTTLAVKAAVTYAIAKFDICIPQDEVDTYVDKILPEVLDKVHRLRVSMFTKMLEQTAEHFTPED